MRRHGLAAVNEELVSKNENDSWGDISNVQNKSHDVDSKKSKIDMIMIMQEI